MRNFANQARTESQRIQLQLQHISTTTSDIRSQRLEDRILADTMNEAVIRHGRMLDIVGQEMRQYIEQHDNNPIHPSMNLDRETSQNTLSGVNPDNSHLICSSSTASPTRFLDTSAVPSNSIFHLIKHQRCKRPCSCVCHRQGCLQSARWLENIVGSLFVGYAGLPLFFNRCNIKSCRRSSQTALCIRYVFPGWLMQRVIITKMDFSQNKGPELLLRVLRVRPNNAPIFDAMIRNNIDIIRHLLRSGEASVLDVSSSGESPLHVSTQTRRYYMTLKSSSMH